VWEEVMMTTNRASVRELIRSMALLPPRAKAWRNDLAQSQSKLASLVDVLLVAYPTTTPEDNNDHEEETTAEALDTILALAVLSRLFHESPLITISEIRDGKEIDEGEELDRDCLGAYSVATLKRYCESKRMKVRRATWKQPYIDAIFAYDLAIDDDEDEGDDEDKDEDEDEDDDDDDYDDETNEELMGKVRAVVKAMTASITRADAYERHQLGKSWNLLVRQSWEVANATRQCVALLLNEFNLTEEFNLVKHHDVDNEDDAAAARVRAAEERQDVIDMLDTVIGHANAQLHQHEIEQAAYWEEVSDTCGFPAYMPAAARKVPPPLAGSANSSRSGNATGSARYLTQSWWRGGQPPPARDSEELRTR
jgi:hypothetical protein